MAAAECDTASDEIVTNKCCVCAEKNIRREAEKYCVDCLEYYCTPCIDMHKSFPRMKDHKLLDKSAFGTVHIQASLPIPTENCPLHKTKVLEMYCKDHDEVICHTCVAVKHRACQQIHSIPDEVDNLYKQSVSAETLKDLKSTKESMKGIKKEKERLLKELQKQRQKATDSIKTYAKAMEAEIKRLESEALKNVEAEFKRIETGLKNEIKEVDGCTAELAQSINNLEKADNNKAQEFVCVKRSVKEIEKIIISTTPFHQPTDVKIIFLADVKIQKCLKELKTLGQLSLGKRKREVRSAHYTIKQERDISIKLTDDGPECWIFGSCFTDDGNLLLTDLKNKKLKRLHSSTDTIKDHLALEAGPIAVCQISKREAAVSLNKSIIQFVSLGNKMATTRKLKMDHYCCGLAYSDGKLFISDEDKALYIHDLNGAMLKKIMTDNAGKSIFSSAKHVSEETHMKLGVLRKVPSSSSVCFDPNLNKLVVTNWKSVFVKVYDLQ